MSVSKLLSIFAIPSILFLFFTNQIVDTQNSLHTSHPLTPINDINGASNCTITNPQIIDDGVTEQKFICDDHHFMSILLTPDNAVALRPHPGCNIDAWGATLYLQPFLQGASPSGTTIDTLEVVGDSIHLIASGSIAGWNPSPDSWEIDLTIEFDAPNKTISGNGEYSITLPGQLTSDLNLYRIASNYLSNVPLLSGGQGDTGDLKEVVVSGDGPGFPFTWNPPQIPSHFPTQSSSRLTLDAIGQYNNVDTIGLALEPINPAYKPSLAITLTAVQEDARMIFGGIFDTSKDQDPFADNIGITPLIKSGSSLTQFQFDLNMSSEALPEEHCEAVGLYDPTASRFLLLNKNQKQPFDIVFSKGPANGGWLPIAGDWNNNGTDTVGLYDPTTSRFYLLDAHQKQPFDIVFAKGLAGGEWLPIAGDWNGDSIDTVGLYDPTTSRFYLLNAHQKQPFDIVFAKGLAGGGWLPIAGDWNGDGIDTVGLYDPTTSRFYLLNAHQKQPFDIVFTKGLAGGGWLPIAGDWNGDGIDTVGLYDPATSRFYLLNAHQKQPFDIVFTKGLAGGGWLPIASDWDNN